MTDLYVRRPVVPVPSVAVTPDLPAEEQAVLTALYALALASVQPGAAVSAAGEAQIRWAIAEALGRQYRPAVTVALGAEASQASGAVREAASAVLAAAHRLGTSSTDAPEVRLGRAPGAVRREERTRVQWGIGTCPTRILRAPPTAPP